jgi:hypothetical protein
VRNKAFGRDGSVEPKEFRDDDGGYRAWLIAHPDGYVINIARSRSAREARLHQVSCPTLLPDRIASGAALTGQYVKVCADLLVELERWAKDYVKQSIPRCGSCWSRRPTSTSARTSLSQTTSISAVRGHRFKVEGPVEGKAVVAAWADAYIRYDHRPAWQEQLRSEIKARSKLLDPSPNEILHAVFVGDKRVNADVENLVLYNIDSFTRAGRNGIRFEHSTVGPPASDDGKYPYHYNYSLVPSENTFTCWQPSREVASFGWTNVPIFSGEIKPAHVWLALARSSSLNLEAEWDGVTPFGVFVQIRGSKKRQARVKSELMKAVLDGVICALQTHTDTSILPDITVRLAASLPADPGEIEEHLLNGSRAALGPVPRLVKPFGANGVQWNPSDHLCLAGELLPAEPAGAHWAIRGRVVALASKAPFLLVPPDRH